jgi:hypothetical protein
LQRQQHHLHFHLHSLRMVGLPSANGLTSAAPRP